MLEKKQVAPDYWAEKNWDIMLNKPRKIYTRLRSKICLYTDTLKIELNFVHYVNCRLRSPVTTIMRPSRLPRTKMSPID